MPKANIESIQYGLTSKLYLLGFMGVTASKASRILYGRDRSEAIIKKRYLMLCEKGICINHDGVFFSNADPFLREADFLGNSNLKRLLESDSFRSLVKAAVQSNRIKWSQKNINCVSLFHDVLSIIIATYYAVNKSGRKLDKEEANKKFKKLSKSLPGLEVMTIDASHEMQKILDDMPEDEKARIIKSSKHGESMKTTAELFAIIFISE